MYIQRVIHNCSCSSSVSVDVGGQNSTTKYWKTKSRRILMRYTNQDNNNSNMLSISHATHTHTLIFIFGFPVVITSRQQILLWNYTKQLAYMHIHHSHLFALHEMFNRNIQGERTERIHRKKIVLSQQKLLLFIIDDIYIQHSLTADAFHHTHRCTI